MCAEGTGGPLVHVSYVERSLLMTTIRTVRIPRHHPFGHIEICYSGRALGSRCRHCRATGKSAKIGRGALQQAFSYPQMALVRKGPRRLVARVSRCAVLAFVVQVRLRAFVATAALLVVERFCASGFHTSSRTRAACVSLA